MNDSTKQALHELGEAEAPGFLSLVVAIVAAALNWLALGWILFYLVRHADSTFFDILVKNYESAVVIVAGISMMRARPRTVNAGDSVSKKLITGFSATLATFLTVLLTVFLLSFIAR